MKCPKCSGTLIKVTIKTRPEYGGKILDDAGQTQLIEVDQCLSCNGVWFDTLELQQYLSEKLIILDSPKIKKAREYNKKIGKCPRCNEIMMREKYKNTVVDICKKCNGLWLDSSEIDRLEDKNITFKEKNLLAFQFAFDQIRQLINNLKRR